MPDTPSDSTPSQEPTPQVRTAADFAKAHPAPEIVFPTKSTVRINPLDRGLERNKEADRDTGLEMQPAGRGHRTWQCKVCDVATYEPPHRLEDAPGERHGYF